MNYFAELRRAMRMLAELDNSIFVGQSVDYGGQAAHATFADVPMEKRLEMPIIEDFQIGFCTGLSLQGFLPISFLPRWDFLIIAANQLINHLDKIPLMGAFRPKVIIRTAVGSTSPLDPGPQHTGNYTHPMRQMLKTIEIFELLKAEDIIPAYTEAVKSKHSVILVEHMREYYK